MPIRITIAGTVFETDSVAEAVEIHRALNRAIAPTPPANGQQAVAFGSVTPPKEKTETGFTNDKIATFVNTLNANGKKIIEALTAHPAGIATDDLARMADLPSASLPPVMRHVRTMAERASLDADMVLKRVQITSDGKPKSRYKLAEEVIQKMKDE